MQLAVKCGLKLAIITGGRSAAVKKRYENLGVQNVFAGISVKIACFQHWLETDNLETRGGDVYGRRHPRL